MDLFNIKQIVPSEACLQCDICCRYPERETSLIPCFLNSEIAKLKKEKFFSIINKVDPKTPPVPYKDYYRCAFFEPDKNTCSLYPLRPIDCKIYPFMVTYSKDFRSVCLTADTKCPYIKNKLGSIELKAYTDYLANIFESEEMIEEINSSKSFINDFQDDSVVLKSLVRLSARLGLNKLGLTRISIKHKPIFEKYMGKADFYLSCYAFAPIYIWSGLLNILWKEIDGALCVFAGNNKDYFMLTPPMGEKLNISGLKKSTEVLDALNNSHSADIKIENCPEDFLEGLRKTGFSIGPALFEYLYETKALVELKGDPYASKRSSINKFIKSYGPVCRPMENKDIFPALELYKEWALKKSGGINDAYSIFLLEDSFFAHKKAIFSLKELGLKGMVIEIEGRLKGYSIGYHLNNEVFVVLFEIADLSIKGLSQFIYREFCKEVANYKYINAMGDSGLDSLKNVKDSYRPLKKIAYYSATLDRA